MNGWIAWFTCASILCFVGALFSAHYHDMVGAGVGIIAMFIALFCLNYEWRRVHGL